MSSQPGSSGRRRRGRREDSQRRASPSSRGSRTGQGPDLFEESEDGSSRRRRKRGKRKNRGRRDNLAPDDALGSRRHSATPSQATDFSGGTTRTGSERRSRRRRGRRRRDGGGGDGSWVDETGSYNMPSSSWRDEGGSVYSAGTTRGSDTTGRRGRDRRDKRKQAVPPPIWLPPDRQGGKASAPSFAAAGFGGEVGAVC